MFFITARVLVAGTCKLAYLANTWVFNNKLKMIKQQGMRSLIFHQFQFYFLTRQWNPVFQFYSRFGDICLFSVTRKPNGLYYCLIWPLWDEEHNSIWLTENTFWMKLRSNVNVIAISKFTVNPHVYTIACVKQSKIFQTQNLPQIIFLCKSGLSLFKYDK